jgi:hypothetical protein
MSLFKKILKEEKSTAAWFLALLLVVEAVPCLAIYAALVPCLAIYATLVTLPPAALAVPSSTVVYIFDGQLEAFTVKTEGADVTEGFLDFHFPIEVKLR